MSTDSWRVVSTRAAKEAINPIRECTEKHFVDAVKKSKKDLYKLGIGMSDQVAYTAPYLSDRPNALNLALALALTPLTLTLALILTLLALS